MQINKEPISAFSARLAFVATATIAVAVSSMYFSPAAQAVNDNYLPDVLLKAKVVSQKKFGEFKATDGKLQAGTVQIANTTKGGLIITGKNKVGAPWTVKRQWADLGGEAYECDLQGSGSKDLLVMTGVNTNGNGAYSQLLVLLMDKDGVPHGYEMVGYFNTTDDEKSLQDVVKAGAVGPVIMRQQIVWGSGNKNYWRNEVYRAVGTKLESWKTSIGSTPFPNYVFYSKNPNHKVDPKSAQLETQTRKDHTGAKAVQIE